VDLYCQRCGEPWEHYYVHQDMTSIERMQFLKGECCPSCRGKEVVGGDPFELSLRAPWGTCLVTIPMG